MRSKCFLSFCMLALAAISPVHASTYDWTYNGDLAPPPGTESGSGSLTTNGAGLITDFSGIWDGFAITLLTPDSFLGNDNLLIYPGTPGFLDFDGVSFQLSPGDDQVNLFYDAGYGAITENSDDVVVQESDGTFTVTPAATPLPAALPLFATGLWALGLLGWRRKRRNAAKLATV
jgi:hypothetical protein